MPGHFPSTPPAPTPAPAPAPLPDYIHVQLLTPIPAPVPAPGYIQIPLQTLAPVPGYIQLPTPVPTGGPAQHAPAPAHAPVQPPPGWQTIVIPGPDGSPPPPPPPYSPTLQPDEVMERYTAAPDWTRVHILDSIIPPWQIPAGSTQPIPFKPFFVHSPTKFKEFFTAMRANPTSIAATEVIPGGNGVWFCGVGIKGSNSLDLDKRLMDLGWDGNRTGRTTVPGERDVVWLWLNRL